MKRTQVGTEFRATAYAKHQMNDGPSGRSVCAANRVAHDSET